MTGFLSPGLSVVIDCGNGAGSILTPNLFPEAGIRTTCLSCNPSGQFGGPSEPLKEYLGYVGEMVKKTGADCAVVHDGDADRMVAFDNRGRLIDGDHLLLLLAEHLGAKKVVTTSDASMIIEEVAEVHRTPVGDAFVSEELLSWGEFGGEPSGAWIPAPLVTARTAPSPPPSSARSPRAVMSQRGWTLCRPTRSSGNLSRMRGHGRFDRSGRGKPDGRDPCCTGKRVVSHTGQRDRAQDPDHR